MRSRGCGLLLIGGEGPNRVFLEESLSSVHFIIAADSGFNLASELDLEPDLLVGDLDSISTSPEYYSFPQDKIRHFPRDKDETDTEIGLRIFHEMGFDQIILAGGGGGRLDHLFGILCLFERDRYPYAWYTAREHVQVIEQEMEFGKWNEQTVSFFLLGDGVEGTHSEGLKWPLDGISWERGGMGISNQFTADHGRVCVEKGKILMIRTLPELTNE